MKKTVQETNNYVLQQGWPTHRSRSTSRSPRLRWSITPDFALNWQDT